MVNYDISFSITFFSSKLDEPITTTRQLYFFASLKYQRRQKVSEHFLIYLEN